jgi:hypothetical protein
MPKPNRQQKNSLIYSGRAPRQGQIPRQNPIYGNAPTSNNVTTPPERQINTLPVRNRDAQNIQQGLTNGANRFQGEKGRRRRGPNDMGLGDLEGYKARGFGERRGAFDFALGMTEAGRRALDRKNKRRDGNAMRGYGPENTERRAERQRLRRNEKIANRSMLSGF